ncbi:kinesin-like protein KIF9 isoform X2 [Convolutriloba macropyga]|uniref:kinesin-like protein KIF9 isoform X2 n=1 Tax=Convolutriloba macropyga TaxID=536237 RepID=UPI003F525582
MPEEPKTVKVYARTRPTDHFAYNHIVLNPDGKSVDLHGRPSDKGGFVNNQVSDWSFKLDGVFHDVSQDLLYEVAVKDVVSRAFAGYNGTVMSYGQTGSGKTFTMTGANETFQNRGVIPRAIQQVFREIGEMPDYAINIKVSYLEIYNETLFDLLSGGAGGRGQQPISIMEDEFGIKVVGLSQQIANTEEEALNLLFEGETTRAIAAHQMNKHSSRSHVIFTITVEARSRTESSTSYTVSKLNFVDLAGSERLGKTQSQGRTQNEATYINKSLTFLEQTIIALTDKKREHVPFRQSKLTHVLKDSIGGNCQTVMFATVWGEEAQLEETISTLRFGTRMMRVPIQVAANQVQDPTAMVKQLEREVRTLKQELSMHDTLNNRANQNYDAITDAQMAEIQRQVKGFLSGSVDSLDIVNVRQIQTVFGVFRQVYRSLEKDIEQKFREKYELTEKAAQASGTAQGADQSGGPGRKTSGMSQDVRLVGELDGQGFSVGVAPASNKPAKSSVVEQKKVALSSGNNQMAGAAVPKKKTGKSSPRSSHDVSPSRAGSPSQAAGEKDSASGAPGGAGAAERPSTPPPRHVAFEDFKREDGAQLNKILNENKEVLKTKINQSREIANQINEVKRNMDRTKDELNQIAAERENLGGFQGLDESSSEQIVEESEYGLILRLKGLKRDYREHYSELQRVRSEVQYCQKLVDQCRQRLISDFDTWYLQSYLGPNVDFTPTVQTEYGHAQATTISHITEDKGERLERAQTDLMMDSEPDSFTFHKAKRQSIRKYNQSKTQNQTVHNDGLIMPAKKPTQMILTAPY